MNNTVQPSGSLDYRRAEEAVRRTPGLTLPQIKERLGISYHDAMVWAISNKYQAAAGKRGRRPGIGYTERTKAIRKAIKLGVPPPKIAKRFGVSPQRVRFMRRKLQKEGRLA